MASNKLLLIRTIPSIHDGLKPSQRKVLYCTFLRNLISEIKVAQLAGYVSEKSSYHHGEMSLQSCIINMAQTHIADVKQRTKKKHRNFSR